MVLAEARRQPLLFVGSSKAYSVLSARVVVARRRAARRAVRRSISSSRVAFWLRVLAVVLGGALSGAEQLAFAIARDAQLYLCGAC